MQGRDLIGQREEGELKNYFCQEHGAKTAFIQKSLEVKNMLTLGDLSVGT